MPTEEEIVQQQQPPAQPQMTADEYAAAVKNLKENTVSKEEFEKLKNEKSVLVKALAGEGPVPDSVSKQAKKSDVKELRKKFLEAGEQNLSNAEYIKTALELRTAIIEEGGIDPFIPSGAKVSPTPKDIEGANKTAEALQSWLDAATDDNGKIDNELFNAFMRKGIAEDSPVIAARIRAANKARK